MSQVITHINFAKGFRGGERQTFLLIKELSLRGYRQKILTRKKSELADKLHGINNLEIIKASKPYILSVYRTKGSDIIHAHETKGTQFAFFVNKIFKIPYIITRRVDNKIKNNFFNKKIYENAKYTVALSNAIKDEVFKISKNVNIQIIPSAFSELAVDSNNVKKIKNRFINKFVLGNIGELDNAHKGQYYLLEAMKKLSQTHPNIVLILLGKGIDELKYKEQVRDLNNVFFEGFVENVGDYIQCFDIFVYPSLHEGLGSILFDVMQSKVPIIASNVGGIPDIIENEKNGILVEIKNSEKLYENIVKLYENKELSESLSDMALANIDKYSYQNMSNKYIKLYNE